MSYYVQKFYLTHLPSKSKIDSSKVESPWGRKYHRSHVPGHPPHGDGPKFTWDAKQEAVTELMKNKDQFIPDVRAELKKKENEKITDAEMEKWFNEKISNSPYQSHQGKPEHGSKEI